MTFFDLHCDTLWQIDNAKVKGEEISLIKNDLMVDLHKLIKGSVGVQCFALFNIPQTQKPFNSAMRMVGYLESACAQTEKLKIVKSYYNIITNLENGVISAVISMEDAFLLEGSLDNLYTLYDKGLRMICLSHNVANGVSHPNFGKYIEGSPDWVTRNSKDGLTDFGYQLVREMNRLGIVVDLSHMSDAGFYQAVKLSDKPVVCSHSNANTLCPSVRNLTDDMLYKLADNGGVTGVCFASGFLNVDKEKGKATIKRSIEHIKYIKNLIGTEHIAIGSDFDGIPPEIDFKTCECLPKLFDELIKEGFSLSEIDKITYENALRVFRANLK